MRARARRRVRALTWSARASQTGGGDAKPLTQEEVKYNEIIDHFMQLCADAKKAFLESASHKSYLEGVRRARRGWNRAKTAQRVTAQRRSRRQAQAAAARMNHPTH